MTDPIFGPWLPLEAPAQGLRGASMDLSAPLHPYGHDLRMLRSSPSYLSPTPVSSLSSPLTSVPVSAARPPRSNLSPLNLPTTFPPPRSETCHLLRLPPELLDQIFAYLLPHTVSSPKGIAWVRSCTAVLATCRFLHQIGAERLYGRNTFVLCTGFRGTTWHCAWTVGRDAAAGGTPILVPSREREWPTAIAERYRGLIRHVAVAVTVEDSYAGEIKYGFGGPGLAEGVRVQVERLVDDLSAAQEIRTLTVRLCAVNGGVGQRDEQRILSPLAKLRNVGSLWLEEGRAWWNLRSREGYRPPARLLMLDGVEQH